METSNKWSSTRVSIGIIFLNDLEHNEHNFIQKSPKGIKSFLKWRYTWNMELNTNKCHADRYSDSNKPIHNCKLGEAVVEPSWKEIDLRMLANGHPNPEDHIYNHKMPSLIANMKSAFMHVDKNMAKKIITSIIRPALEHVAIVWRPSLRKDIDKMERVHQSATRWPPPSRDLNYEDRLCFRIICQDRVC